MRHVARNRNDPIFRRLVVRNLRQKLLATKRQKLLRVWWPSSVQSVKQDIIVADATGTAKLTLWEDNVNSLEQGHSYKLVDHVVRIW